MKHCRKCGIDKPLTEFYTSSRGKKSAWCKPCTIQAAKDAYRSADPVAKARNHARVVTRKWARSTPRWADETLIQNTYQLAAARAHETGVPHDVDHIVPLRSPLVCGLHTHDNLQVIHRKLNRQKQNSVWPDMP